MLKYMLVFLWNIEMEALKRIVNLIYALCGVVLLIFLIVSPPGVPPKIAFITIGVISLVVAVINFSLFKKLTLWNK